MYCLEPKPYLDARMVVGQSKVLLTNLSFKNQMKSH